MRIRPGTHVGLSESGRLVIGEGEPRRQMRKLTPSQARLLERLLVGEPLPMPSPGSTQVTEYAQLLSVLKPWLEQVDPTLALPGLAAERLRPDARAWSAAWDRTGSGIAAHDVMSARMRSSIWVSRVDRTGLALCMALAGAGVGRVAVPEDGVIGAEDLGTSPLRLTELGLPRPSGLARHVSRLYPQTHVLSPVPMQEGLHGADVAVMVVAHGFDETQIQAVAASGVPVIPVVLTATGFQIGPLSGGYSGPGPWCGGCTLQAWPCVDRDGAEVGPPSPPESTTAVAVAGLAAQAALMVLDGVSRPQAAGGSLVGDLHSGGVEFRPLRAACAHRVAA